jgi:hypothetical protein
MSLKDTALAADKERREQSKRSQEDARIKGRIWLEQNWEKRWTGFDLIPELPGIDEFEWMTSIPGSSPRHSNISGWSFTIDDVTFLYNKEQGMHVILTCPECGAKHAATFYSLDSLGQLLRNGRGMYHKCRESQAKSLAYAIGAAARDANTSPALMIDLALEHSDVSMRARGL